MTFKAGDKVRYKPDTDCPSFFGLEGEVVCCDGVSTDVNITKGVRHAPTGGTATLTTSNLELIDPSFTFADIQVGDKIRRTYTRDTGTTEVREGVVSRKDESVATDTSKPIGSYILAYDSDGHPDKPAVKLELLERPEPPHWTESKPVGSVGVILDGVFTKTLRKTSENGWQVHYVEDEHTYEASNADVKNRTAQWASESKLTWIK